MVRIDRSWLVFITVLPDRVYLRDTITFITICNHRLVCLLLLIFVDPLQNAIHLLLQEQLEFLDHEFIDWTSFNEV